MSIKNILAKKIGSTTIFKDGESKHATILKSGPCTITQIKSKKVDGYSAIQLGFESAKNLNKPLTGQLIKTKSKFRTLKEFRVSDDISNKVGDSIDVSIFSKGQYLNITAKSKGRGFTGTVKRWNFKGGPKTHGQSDRHRAPGSIGAGSTPGKGVKGKKCLPLTKKLIEELGNLVSQETTIEYLDEEKDDEIHVILDSDK